VGMTANNARCPPHHWMLGQPEGRTTEGVCKNCGARQTFPAVYEWHGYQANGASKLPPIRLKRV